MCHRRRNQVINLVIVNFFQRDSKRHAVVGGIECLSSIHFMRRVPHTRIQGHAKAAARAQFKGEFRVDSQMKPGPLTRVKVLATSLWADPAAEITVLTTKIQVRAARLGHRTCSEFAELCI
jgi:hypothetical protein